MINVGYMERETETETERQRKTDETIVHIIHEYSKLAQKEYKSWHYWVDTVIQWELRKRLNFDNWSTQRIEFVQENETHKILWDF